MAIPSKRGFTKAIARQSRMLKYIMKVAWAMKRTRPDLEPTNSFLMTRVQKPNKDNWHKLMGLMSFIKGTLNDK